MSSAVASPVKPAVEAWLKRHPLRKWIEDQSDYYKTRAGFIPAIAVKLGVRRQQVYNWLAGKSVPSMEAIAKIEKVTGVTYEQWLAWRRKAPAGALKSRGKPAAPKRSKPHA